MSPRPKLALGDYLPYLVNRVGTIIADQFSAEALAPHGLSIAMWRVMAALSSNGGQRQIDLADLTSIEASTLSRLVTRLTHMGLVTRSRSASSNREVDVKLSAKGDAMVAQLIPIAIDYERTAGAGLSAQDVRVLKRWLSRVFENMTQRDVVRMEPTGQARSGRPDDKLRTIRVRPSRINAAPGLR